mgnify:CR=1 FL=1|jgi:type IV pilus assembly protein PilP
MRTSQQQMKMLAVLACSLLLVACSRGDNFSDLQDFVNEVSSRAGVEVEPVPEFDPYEGFIYGAAARRSPFEVPFVVDSASDEFLAQDVEPDFERVPELLENHFLGELSMVGSLNVKGVYQALIKDSFGEVHRVEVGNYMGRNYGRIRSISKTQLNLIEIVPSTSGGWLERPQTLALQ